MNKRLQDLLEKGEELEKKRKELSDNWIKEKILVLKSPIRKRKIKSIFNE